MFDPLWAQAIGNIESSGNYGQVTDSGKGRKALGKYQVMDFNVAPWTQEVLGRSMTPDEFLSDPSAQDKVFQTKFGSFADKYGSPQDAASVWFSGRPIAKAGNAQDVLGTTVPAYVAKFNKELGMPSGVSAIQAAMRPTPAGDSQAMPFTPTPPPDNGFLGQIGSGLDKLNYANPRTGFDLSDALGGAGAAMMALDNPAGGLVLSKLQQQEKKAASPGTAYQYDPKSGTFFRTRGDGTLETMKNPNAVSAAEVNPNTVKAILEGRAPYPANSRATDAAAIREAVNQADPTFDAVNYNSRLKTRQDFTSGKSAGNLTAFNTAIGHLGTLNDAIDGLQNSGSSAYNTVANAISGQTSTDFASARSKFNIAKTAVADELTRAFRLSGGNVHDIEQWEKAIYDTSSPEALKASVQQAAELLKSRVDAVGDQYNRGMGTTKDPIELLNPKAAEAFKGLLGAGKSSKPSTGASDVEAEMRRRGLLK